jgi:hypothetical protein
VTRRNLPSRGIAAGLTGTVFLVLLLLVTDAVSNSPTSQLKFLPQLWFGTTSLWAIVASLLVVFVVLVAISWGVQLMDETPPFLLGGAAGLVLFSLVFYASVVMIGTNVINEVSWRVLLPGALLAGFAAVAYLRVTAGAPMVGLTDALREHRVVREGLVTGILGGAAVALWFLAIDVSAGRPFFTPAALGAAFIQGHSSMAAVEITFMNVAGYTLLHFAIFIFIGLLAARVSADAERDPPLILALVLMFVVLEVTSLGVIAAMAAWLFESIPWWNFLVANLIAAGVMGVYLWRKHGVLQQHVRSNVEEALAHTR